MNQPDEILMQKELAEFVVTLLSELKPRQKFTVIARHSHGWKLKEIASILEVTTSRVQQINLSVRRKFREPPTMKQIKRYIDIDGYRQLQDDTDKDL